MVSKGMLAAVTAALLYGCIRYEPVHTPLYYKRHRADVKLAKPLLLTLTDERDERGAHRVLIRDLKRGLSHIYGSAITWRKAIPDPPDNRVTMNIRVTSLNARKGARELGPDEFEQGDSGLAPPGGWETVIKSASAKKRVLEESFSPQGWWIGSAVIKLEVTDRRDPEPAAFSVPVVAEHKEADNWGNASAKKAAEQAWRGAVFQLQDTLDVILRKLAKEQSVVPASQTSTASDSQGQDSPASAE